MRPIDPESVEKHYHIEPTPPKPPTQSGGTEGPLQTTPGPVSSAPTSTGVNFEGVGVGLGSFVPGSNPPDVNGRVGPTQYVQWNNTSFAVFNKNTGALEYGPAAGSRLRHRATENDRRASGAHAKRGSGPAIRIAARRPRQFNSSAGWRGRVRPCSGQVAVRQNRCQPRGGDVGPGSHNSSHQ